MAIRPLSAEELNIVQPIANYAVWYDDGESELIRAVVPLTYARVRLITADLGAHLDGY